jgi:hypothetical protein
LCRGVVARKRSLLRAGKKDSRKETRMRRTGFDLVTFGEDLFPSKPLFIRFLSEQMMFIIHGPYSYPCMKLGPLEKQHVGSGGGASVDMSVYSGQKSENFGVTFIMNLLAYYSYFTNLWFFLLVLGENTNKDF